MEAMV